MARVALSFALLSSGVSRSRGAFVAKSGGNLRMGTSWKKFKQEHGKYLLLVGIGEWEAPSKVHERD